MKISVLSGASALALGACTNVSTPLPIISSQQATTNADVTSAVNYQDPLAGYTFRAPTGPRDWREVNDEQSEGN